MTCKSELVAHSPSLRRCTVVRSVQRSIRAKGLCLESSTGIGCGTQLSPQRASPRVTALLCLRYE
jgi:hypothetical protein